MADLEDILNFVQLTEDVGTAGQPMLAQFATIAEAGYKTVINLAMPDSDNALPEEGRLVTELGMRYIHLPVDFAAPTAAHARTFFGIMAAVSDEKVFVHCAMNLRVSAFMFLYLRHVRGFDEAAASTPLIAKWQPSMDKAWQNFMALELAQIEDSS